MKNEHKNNEKHIYIDTNVLIGYKAGNEADVKCLNFLFAQKRKKLFVSSLSLAQFISKKIGISKEDKVKFIKTIFSKVTVLNFLNTDILEAIKKTTEKTPDVEDNIQYIVGNRAYCYYFITNNKKDYNFVNIKTLKSSQVRLIND